MKAAADSLQTGFLNAPFDIRTPLDSATAVMLDMVLRQARKTTFGILMICAVLFGMGQYGLLHPGHRIWAVMLIVISLVRRWRLGVACDRLRSADHTAFAMRELFFWTWLQGLIVAIGTVWLMRLGPDNERMLLTVIELSWLAGGLSPLGLFPWLYGVYTCLFGWGLIVGWVLPASDLAWVATPLILAFIGTVVTFSVSFSRSIARGIELRFANEKLLRQVSEAKEAAEESSDAKSRFLAVASHDLRQPLHALSLLTGLLQRSDSVSKAHDIGHQIQQSVRVLDDLMGSVLDFSKLESRAIQPNLEWVALDTLMTRTLQSMQPSAQHKGLMITAAPTHLSVWADPVLLERVLRNLLDNAIKFTLQGRITLLAHQVIPEAPAEIRIHDTGIGIPANLHQQVFKEYFQAEGSRQLAGTGATGAGLGLGLAIVKRLCDMMGARIHVEDNIPRGACFVITFPPQSVRVAAQSVDVLPPTAQPDATVSLEGLRVLCVDDDPASLDALRSLLESWGCVVLTASSSAQAIALGDQLEGTQVVLSDFNLGEETNGA